MREKIKLVSSAGTGHYYTTTKNRRNTPNKLELRKPPGPAVTAPRLRAGRLTPPAA